MQNSFWKTNAIFFPYYDTNTFKQKLVYYIDNEYDTFVYLDGFNIPYLYDCFPTVVAFGVKNQLLASCGSAFEVLKTYCKDKQNPIFGFLNFELKNEVENITSQKKPQIKFPDLYFFEPTTIILFLTNGFYFYSEKYEIEAFVALIENFLKPEIIFKNIDVNINETTSKQIYLDDIDYILSKIQRGDVYEINYCKESIVKNYKINPFDFFIKLTSVSPMPFSCFVKYDNKYVICASPERFLKKSASKIISQPIKGTSRRGKNAVEDAEMIRKLIVSEKERAENIMIVDLVRNDLSHTAKDSSVCVEELCKVYTFATVHQMISTVTAIQSKKKSFVETIKHCFPMGSMTGAPKLSALKLIEETEKSSRGLFSGSIGYIMPNSDFDFNVVIRTVFYDSIINEAIFQAGSAITSDALPEDEYEECKTKLAAIMDVINQF